MRYFLFVIMAGCAVQVVADESAKDPVFSGPQAGEKLAPISALNVLVDESKKVDLIARAKAKPTLLVFFHERTRPAFGLTNAVMRFAQTKHEKLSSAAIFLTSDATETERWMKNVKKHFPKDAFYGLSPDGIEGPGAYGLNREVQLTVLVAKDGVVTNNFAIVQPSIQADGPKIITAIAKAIGEKAPDMSKVLNVQRRGARQPGRPNGKNGQRQGLAPELATLVRALIQKNATAEEVDAVAKKIDDLIRDRKDYQQQLGTVVNRIVGAKVLERYGTERAQKHLSVWGKKYKPAVTEKSKPAAD